MDVRNFLSTLYQSLPQNRQHSSMSTLASSGYCTSSEDGKRCTCKRYQRPETVVPGQPTVCEECAHGRSHHDGGESDAISYGGVNVLKTLHRISDFNTQKLSEARMETNLYRAKSEAIKETTKGSRSGSKTVSFL